MVSTKDHLKRVLRNSTCFFQAFKESHVGRHTPRFWMKAIQHRKTYQNMVDLGSFIYSSWFKNMCDLIYSISWVLHCDMAISFFAYPRRNSSPTIPTRCGVLVVFYRPRWASEMMLKMDLYHQCFGHFLLRLQRPILIYPNLKCPWSDELTQKLRALRSQSSLAKTLTDVGYYAEALAVEEKLVKASLAAWTHWMT
jgi:hypothetical protein